jgi:N-terminal domain of anti-restriction factor ArdC
MATATKTRKSSRRRSPGAKKAGYAAERAEQAAAMRARLAAFQGDEDNAALIAMALATFDGYSDRNATLIAMQNPAATDVSGYRQWIARGRRVARGETGIKILAPAGTGTVKADVEGGEDVERRFFRMATVFDIAQTLTLAEWDAAEAARLAAAPDGDDEFELAA